MTRQDRPAPPPRPDYNAVLSQSEAWLFRLRADDVTAEQQADFARWLAADPAHSRAWDETEALFAALAAPARSCLDGEPLAVAVASCRHPRPRRVNRRAAVLGAGLMVMLAMASGLWDDWLADARSGTGERRDLALDDGSRIELDTDTALDFGIGPTARTVHLRHGRAFFTVAPDPNRPFVVTTAHGEVRVIGTRFSVQDRGATTAVAVEEGRVALSAAGPAPRVLTRLQQSEIAAGGISPPVAVDATAEFAWRRGQIVFRDQPLAALVEQLDRYWPGRVVVINPDLAGRRLSGVFDIGRRDDSLAALETLLGARTWRVTPLLTLLY